MDSELKGVYSLFFDELPISERSIDTSRGEADFRLTFLIETATGARHVLKLADNDFTFPEKICVWQRTVEEYRKLGYYCPRIIPDKIGGFPIVAFRGHKCVAYGEEYAPYRCAEDRFSEDFGKNAELYRGYSHDIWRMTARVAALRLDYSKYPSAYCLFETFCPSDKTDEVLENALNWKQCADALPESFREQTRRIWRLWTENREALERVYFKLPHSVFQADLNASNILLDEDGTFVGIYDFNLCGRDVFLNYLIRECDDVSEIQEALECASEVYPFTAIEKDTALMLYRCLKPLWFTRVQELKDAGDNPTAIKAALDKSERELTDQIAFFPD